MSSDLSKLLITICQLSSIDTKIIGNRGLALGFNEFAGYISVAIVGFVTGYLASSFGLKPYPFYIGIAFAVLGFLISWLDVKDTRKYTALEINNEERNDSSSGDNNK